MYLLFLSLNIWWQALEIDLAVVTAMDLIYSSDFLDT